MRIIKELLDVKTPSIKNIAKKHGVSEDSLNHQLKMGIRVEMEHTTDKKLATEIATDHINEDPEYYTKLKKMEAAG